MLRSSLALASVFALVAACGGTANEEDVGVGAAEVIKAPFPDQSYDQIDTANPIAGEITLVMFNANSMY